MMFSCLPATMTVCVIPLYLSRSVEPMVLPISHLAEQAARNHTLKAIQMYANSHAVLYCIA